MQKGDAENERRNDTGLVSEPVPGDWVRESLEQRLERLRFYTESTRFALTEDDVRWDYETGQDRF